MGYYTRDNGDQIYAAIALRLGKIITQYEDLKVNENEEKYEATLYLAILQNLLTIGNEYGRSKYFEKMLKAMNGQEKNYFKTKFESCHDFEVTEWGIKKGCWVQNTFMDKISLKTFLEKMRNSVSHPAIINYYSAFPSTGYTTLDDDKTIIKKFGFVNSPDTRNNELKTYDSIEKVEAFIKYQQTIHALPEDVTYSTNDGKNFFIEHNSEPLFRVSKIELSVEELGFFVKKLAEYFAQPLDEKWEGNTIIPLHKLAA